VFYVLAFVFTSILAVIQQGVRLEVETIIFPQWGPGLAALAMLLLFKKDAQRLVIQVKAEQWPRYAAALLFPLAGGVLVFFLSSMLPGVTHSEATFSPSLLIVGGMLFGAFGEELGWRGYLQKLLGQRASLLATSIVVGILWALWHVGLYQNGPVYMAFLVLTMIGYSIFVSFLIRGTECNVTIATLFHLGVNVSNLLVITIINSVGFMIANGIVWGLLALILVVARQSSFLSRPHEAAQIEGQPESA
jgi:membrane protease YdiL (CAAX protease family)